MEHVWYKCQQPCTIQHCQWCEGGLGLCTVCNAAEGELLEECPGYELTAEAHELCYKGQIKTVADLKPEHRAK